MEWILIASVVKESLWGMHCRPTKRQGSSTSKHEHWTRQHNWSVSGLFHVSADIQCSLVEVIICECWQGGEPVQLFVYSEPRTFVVVWYRYLLLVSDPSSKCFPARPRRPLRRAQQHLASRGAEKANITQQASVTGIFHWVRGQHTRRIDDPRDRRGTALVIQPHGNGRLASYRPCNGSGEVAKWPPVT